MCGFTGIYAFNELGRFFSINAHQSNEALAHRGPDAARLFTDKMVALGHRRLSIIDLSPDAHQPMTDASARYTIVFNGEIYNYQALRQQLIAKGHAFRSQSDTEVLLQAYIEYGEKCLEKLNGFFAFAVYDEKEQSLFLARDRFGIKPLVYYLDEDKLVFASEIGALLAYNLPVSLDYTSLFSYLQLSYTPAPHTIFQDTFKLPPGHWMKVKGREVQTAQWYELPQSHAPSTGAANYESAGEKLLSLLEESVKDRLIADVPLGAFLSGGIDSSVVVALASRHTQHLNTFSVGYTNEPMFDETHYANLVADRYQTNHTVFKLGNDDFFDHIGQLLGHFAEPFADASAIPFYILSQRTRQKVTVALSGDGADELFAGYHKYWGEFKARENGLAARTLRTLNPVLGLLPKSRNTPWGNKLRQLHRFSQIMHLSLQERYWFLCTWRDAREIPHILTPETWSSIDHAHFKERKKSFIQEIKGGDFNEVLRADLRLLLPNDMLHKADMMSMAHGLEVRVPFLDHRVVEWAFSLPGHFKIDGQMKKKILQDAARPLLPPALYNRPKRGFEVPLAKGFRRELRPWVEEMLHKDFVAEQGIFQTDFTEKLKKKVMRGTNYDQNQVWAILAFQHWWKKFGHRIKQPSA